MNQTNTMIFAICVAVTMAGSSTIFSTRALADEKPQPTVQSVSDNVTNEVNSAIISNNNSSKCNKFEIQQIEGV